MEDLLKREGGKMKKYFFAIWISQTRPSLKDSKEGHKLFLLPEFNNTRRRSQK